MTKALLIAAFLLIGILGDWIMDRADRFLKDHVQGEEQEEENLDPDAGKSQQQVIDELSGQLRIFDDE
jgi:hypothetical protein